MYRYKYCTMKVMHVCKIKYFHISEVKILFKYKKYESTSFEDFLGWYYILKSFSDVKYHSFSILKALNKLFATTRLWSIKLVHYFSLFFDKSGNRCRQIENTYFMCELTAFYCEIRNDRCLYNIQKYSIHKLEVK